MGDFVSGVLLAVLIYLANLGPISVKYSLNLSAIFQYRLFQRLHERNTMENLN